MRVRLITINADLVDSLLFQEAVWPAPKNVRALTTKLHGGLSRGVYASMNAGDHVGDDLVLVKKNRELLRNKLSLPNDPMWLNQVHGIDVVDLNAALNAFGGAEEGSLITADGSYTKTPGVVCAILTADCMPIFLTNKAGDRVSLLHAGWRSLAGGIIEQGIKGLDCDAPDIIAWAGPCIGPDSFEVGDEVRQQLGGPSIAYVRSDRSTQTKLKWFANLYLLAGHRLAKAGVKHYSHSSSCTFKDSDDFFSYRRTGQCGRMASLIWMD